MIETQGHESYIDVTQALFESIFGNVGLGRNKEEGKKREMWSKYQDKTRLIGKREKRDDHAEKDAVEGE